MTDKILLIFLLDAIIFIYCGYIVLTTKTKFIKVIKKYKYVAYGFTQFMIIDENLVHYNVTNSLLYCKWSCIEMWYNIETNKDVAIKYYGWRIPFLGMFPCIVQQTPNYITSV
jgi:hypothetical protein